MEIATLPSGKVIPPGLPSAYVERPSLSALLSDGLRRRLICLVAGAGFGKSTTLATWGPTVRSSWYTAGPEDSSLGFFGRGILESLRLRLPNLPLRLFPALQDISGPRDVDLSQAEALAGLLASALHEELKTDHVLIVDDVHEIEAASSSFRLIEALCRQAPDLFHLVLASRTLPPFRIDRLRGRGHVLEIDASVLAFTEEEVRHILQSSVDEEGAALASAIYRTTDGWPAAVRLAAEALRTTTPSDRAQMIDRLPRPGGPLFAYLAHEVIAGEPDDVRELIRRVARLRRFTPELCERLGVPNAAAILTDLDRRGIFIESGGHAGGWYSTSTLGREFALQHLLLKREEQVDVLQRAAQWFEENGFYADALAVLEDLLDAPRIASMLRRHGAQVLTAGHVERIIAAADVLPEELRDPHIEQLSGQARLVRGDWDGALRCFRRAAGSGTDYPPALAWRMGLIHHLRGDFDAALAILNRADTSEGGSDDALLHAWTASVLWVKGDVNGCRAHASRSLEVANQSGDPQALAAAHTALAMVGALEGDRRADDSHYFLAMDAAERAGDVLQLIRIGANHAATSNEEGSYSRALAEVDRVMALAETTGFATFLGLCYINRGDALLGLGRLDEAMAAYQASREVYQRLDSSDLCYSMVGMADVHRERGELAPARSAYEEAVRIAGEVGDTQGLIPALAGLARVIASDDLERALALLDTADSYGVSIYQVRARIARGWIVLSSGEAAGATRIAEQVIAYAHGRRDPACLAEALELAALADRDGHTAVERIQAAREIWRGLGNIVGEARTDLAKAIISSKVPDETTAEEARRRLRDLGVSTHGAASGPLAVLEQQRHSPVAIRSLGGLQLLRQDRPVPSVEWQSKKARDLLKILLSRRGRLTPREQLMETLWPEEEPAKLANRLSVALTTVRAVLDPQKRFDPEYFVIADKTAVGLDLDHVDWDVERFLTNARAGFAFLREGRRNEALPLLAAAENVYTGDFLEEDIYEEWSVALREEARAAYISVTRTLAAAAAEAGDHDSAARYWLRLLERDPYDEPAHLDLVRTLDSAGRHGEARRWYRTYVARMGELGVESAPFPAVAPSPASKAS